MQEDPRQCHVGLDMVKHLCLQRSTHCEQLAPSRTVSVTPTFRSQKQFYSRSAQHPCTPCSGSKPLYVGPPPSLRTTLKRLLFILSIFNIVEPLVPNKKEIYWKQTSDMSSSLPASEQTRSWMESAFPSLGQGTVLDSFKSCGQFPLSKHLLIL